MIQEEGHGESQACSHERFQVVRGKCLILEQKRGAEEIMHVTSYVLTANKDRAPGFPYCRVHIVTPVDPDIVPHHEEEIFLLSVV